MKKKCFLPLLLVFLLTGCMPSKTVVKQPAVSPLEAELQKLREAGIPTTIEELNLPDIPDSENGTIVSQKTKAAERIIMEEHMLTLNSDIDIDLFFGPGEGELGSGPKAFDIRNDLLVIDNHRKKEIKVFDIKQKKLIKSFFLPPGETTYILIASDNTIYCSRKEESIGEYPRTTIYKLSQDGKTLFKLKDSELPDKTKEAIYKKFPHAYRPEIYWEELFIDQNNSLYVRSLTSVLHYDQNGKLLGIVPGIPGISSNFFFWLTPEEKYVLGGKLSIYTKDGKFVKSINLPRNRNENLFFQEESKYGTGFIPIIGTDVQDNIYLLTHQTKEKPVVVKKLDSGLTYTINYDKIIWKFNLNGDLLKRYEVSGPIRGFSMEKKQVQVTPDGTIYYWKYFNDRMELWRILPQGVS